MENIKTYFNNILKDIYNPNEIGIFYRTSMEHVCCIPKQDTYFRKDTDFSDKQTAEMKSIANRLQKNEPIEYILEETQFLSLKFKLNKHVLIPRPETEELVDWIKKDIDNNQKLSIIDIGTGSGCIGVSLAKFFSNATVTALDISKEALQIAQQNAEFNNVKLQLLCADILNFANKLQNKYDIIVSNPPYVRECEKSDMEENVLKYEPHLALFVSDENSLVFYDEIAKFAISHLNDNGSIYVEINRYLGNETLKVFESYNFNCIMKNDLSGANRMIKAIKIKK
ncbi:MAG: peptide chain release factor N(5)-glutamine methyltransferase [Bacteroidia bacterium]|nr:peptide chain release factor N(5)-glutamine methyltransferase [Bacteroidia bacterium]